MESPRGSRRRRKSSLLDIQNEIVRRGSTNEERNQCLTRMSWYQDAMQQQGVSAADLKALLDADDSEKATTTTADDNNGADGTLRFGDSTSGGGILTTKQLAEQHKIMAIHRARQLLEESIGHAYVPPPPLDLVVDRTHRHHHHHRPSSSSSSPSSPSYRPPHLVLPELPKRTAALESFAARQTCLIPPNVPINISMDERNPILIDPTDEPDVQMGDVVPEGSVATRGTIVARCQACSVALRVSLKATLVRCPKCRELSPASDRPALAAADESSIM